MSAILEGYLDEALREPLFDAIESVIKGFGTTEYTAEEKTPQAAQERFILQLSNAITDEVTKAVAVAVQQYLITNVTTNLGLIVVPSTVGIPHTHVVPPLPLNAP